ncbi:MAG TPA: DUF6622 family protein [Ramlibacter sp.]|jgi:hypothetical protein|uniref:DUF6622 family protein n=1 Tax=Ramlibacter sp. TaxID=1917967 RepID=UPI002D295716|nr:DUF6622 family protein [Ramlibacter sp.]HZY19625.1 DUF6622 family protein [Ramlibacter sp.]
MLIQLVYHHPEALGPILRHTPPWVWGLFAGLLALGLSQLRDRTASLLRVSLLPVAMTAFSAWGTVSAFASSPLFGAALNVWIGLAVALFALIAPGRANATYHPGSRSFDLPGSAVPLLLILGLFLVKYAVGVELAMDPHRMTNGTFALTVAALYGAFTGLFVGRAARLWRLAMRPRGPLAA